MNADLVLVRIMFDNASVSGLMLRSEYEQHETGVSAEYLFERDKDEIRDDLSFPEFDQEYDDGDGGAPEFDWDEVECHLLKKPTKYEAECLPYVTDAARKLCSDEVLDRASVGVWAAFLG
jgi:hypothetical protein